MTIPHSVIRQSLNGSGISCQEIAALDSFHDAVQCLRGIADFARYLGYHIFHDKPDTLGIREPLDMWVMYYVVPEDEVEAICNL